MARGRRTSALLAAGVSLAIALASAGCGAEDYPNDARPPLPVEVTASITEKSVRVQPESVGSGEGRQPINQNAVVEPVPADAEDPLTVVFTIANLTNSKVQMILSGPIEAHSAVITPHGNTELKIGLETGTYRVRVPELPKSNVTTFTVGPDRISSQDDLLLP